MTETVVLAEMIRVRIGSEFDGECHLTDNEANRIIDALIRSDPAVRDRVTDEMVRRAAVEYLSHKGERPNRVTRGGWELWESCSDAMRAALTAALRASPPEPASGWMPIETAPKDGARIDLWREYNQMRLTDAYWSDGKWQWKNYRYDEPDDQITHWRPLPTPPAKEPQ